MIRLQPLKSWPVKIHGDDFAKASNILNDYGVSTGILDTYIPPFYALVSYWKGVRVPDEKFTEITSAFDMAGIRYEV
jgi:membrane protein DedA with SNARE-associated domain